MRGREVTLGLYPAAVGLIVNFSFELLSSRVVNHLSGDESSDNHQAVSAGEARCGVASEIAAIGGPCGGPAFLLHEKETAMTNLEALRQKLRNFPIALFGRPTSA